MRLVARIAGVGLLGPGLPGWEASRAALAGRAPFARTPVAIPTPEALPATERRRAGTSVKLALAAGLAAAKAAGRDPATLAAVFASSSGDGETCHAICEVLASDDRQISPMRFHNSVHNAPAGYWSIATGATASADCLAAFDGSFGAGLLEALARLADDPALPVVLVAYDAPYPEPLHAARPVPEPFAVAMVLDPETTGAGPLLRAETTRDAPRAMANGQLERVRREIPAARSLPLLELLARAEPGSATLEYLERLALRVELAP